MGKLDKFVQVGRVAFIANGADSGKVCAIAEIVDQNRVLIDGPCTGVRRQVCDMKRLHLTGFHLPLPHSSRTAVVRRKWLAANLDERWTGTSWAKKLEARRLRASMTDFDRFRCARAKQIRNRIVSVAMGSLRKTSSAKLRKPNKKRHLRKA
uniref:Large ribosomal subunit protein eL14 n=2 Tax=Macrostomum lignano TaxID=282301 RepID=A0A1I8IB88_9PLAT